MPSRSRSHGSDEEPSRARGAHGLVGSVRGGEDAVAEVVRAGRSTADGGTGGSLPHTVLPATQPTGVPGGRPDGRPTRVNPDDDPPTRRSIEMENSAAATLAIHGWYVRQNPTPVEVAQARRETADTGNPESNPDYLLEGHGFDAYSPTKPTKSVRNIWSGVEDKVIVKEQTQRVVLNLEDWRGDLSALRKQFADWPIENFKEVKAITPDGDIVQIDLPE